MLRRVPQQGQLEQKAEDIILIAMNVAITHWYGAGARRIRNVLKPKATLAEIVETIQWTKVFGMHLYNLSITFPMEEVENA